VLAGLAPNSAAVSSGSTHWAAILTCSFAGIAAIGVLFAWFAVREARRARLATTASGFYSEWNGREMVDARKAVADKGGPVELAAALVDAYNTNSPDYYTLIREANFYENLGLLVRSDKSPIMRRSAYLKLIRLFLGSQVVNRFDYWKPAIDALRAIDIAANTPQKKKWYRRAMKADTAYREFEDLAERLRKKLRMARTTAAPKEKISD
jgi:hypothetical protein